MLLSRARRWPMPSIPLTRFFMAVFFIVIYLLLMGSDVAVQRTQAADFFHSLNQVLHILHNNTSKIGCVLFFLFISAADAANVHHGIVAGLGHIDRDLPCRKLLHRKSSVSQSVVFPGVYSAESFTSPRLKVWVL